MTKERARIRKQRRQQRSAEGPQVPSWGPALLQFVVMFLVMAVLKGRWSTDGFNGSTFLWAFLVAATLTAINEWQSRRKKAKTKTQ
ncbi:MAG: hypothetical protein ACKO1O_04610 [Erythrobacter sp.]